MLSLQKPKRRLTRAADDQAWCRHMLPLVSRTFALCIRMLKQPLRDQVGIAYLLCRIADTIEDHPTLAVDRKLSLLQQLQILLQNPQHDSTALAATFAAPQDDEELLVKHCGRVLRIYADQPAAVQQIIHRWVDTMCAGMARWCQADGVRDLDELDDYCFIVAGTVGHLLTDLFRLHHRRLTRHHHQRLKELATSFGIGLQLTNIIKDVHQDRQRGICWIPEACCRRLGLEPEQFLTNGSEQASQQILAELINKTEAHLRDALQYCLTLPRSGYRIRLFCLTPLFFAIRTLHQTRRGRALLEPQSTTKISRRDVAGIVRTLHIIAMDNRLLQRYYQQLTSRHLPC